MNNQTRTHALGFEVQPQVLRSTEQLLAHSPLWAGLPRQEFFTYEWRFEQTDSLKMSFWIHESAQSHYLKSFQADLQGLLEQSFVSVKTLTELNSFDLTEYAYFAEMTRQVSQQANCIHLRPNRFKAWNWSALAQILSGHRGLVLSIKLKPTQIRSWEHMSQPIQYVLESIAPSKYKSATAVIETLESAANIEPSDTWEISIQLAYPQPEISPVLLQQIKFYLLHAEADVHIALREHEKQVACDNLKQGQMQHWMYNPLPENQQRLAYLYDSHDIQELFLPPWMVPAKGQARVLEINQKSESGIFLGVQPLSGQKVFLPAQAEHAFIVGKTGMGKSSLMQQMILSQIDNGDGLAVFDPHGDLCRSVLAHLPNHRLKDVIWLDTAQTDYPFGLNLLNAKNNQEAELMAQELVSMGIKLYGDEIFGPRIQNYALNGALTLMSNPDQPGTLLELPRLFTDDKFRKKYLSKVKSARLKAFWENEFEQTLSREKGEMIPYFNAKFAPFISSSVMSHIFGQGKNTLDFDAILRNQQIVLITLNQSLIGELACRMLSMVFLSQFSAAAFRQAGIEYPSRKRFSLYLDEFHNFTTRQQSIASGANQNICRLLSEGRKYGLSLMMATQYLNQLPTDVKESIFGNVSRLVAFRGSLEDSLRLSLEFQNQISADDLMAQAPLNAYVADNSQGHHQVFSLKTSYEAFTPALTERQIDAVKQLGALKYGRAIHEVALEVEQRIYY